MNSFYEGRVGYSLQCVLLDHLHHKHLRCLSINKTQKSREIPRAPPEVRYVEIPKCMHLAKGLKCFFWTLKFKIPWYRGKIKTRGNGEKSAVRQLTYFSAPMSLKYLKGIYSESLQEVVFLDFCHRTKWFLSW